ncbi:EEF1AKMT4-ECE2 readthrough transcript protein-like isoform X3 [Dermacentor albipictus]|uniref:EEF1AKMT4-ECE2 readthrough transcript protein-like isoform X3 n=1 Tax=Dermacentor albipictus TaxID=60249 RepID=UPI0031FDA368
MSQTTPSKKKSLHPYAGLVEGIKRQEQAKARKQPKERPKVLRDRRASKMSVLKQEVPGETAAVQQQQPISSAMGAGQALAEQWHVQGARTAPAAAKISAQGLKDSRASSTTTRKSGGVQFHQQTVLVVAVIAVTVLLLVTVTGVLVGIGVARGKNKTCRTEGCLRYSKALLESMDTSTNPCHDFSRYVCGRYSNPRNYSVQEEAQFQFRKEIAMAARNTSLTATGQNELQKTLRFLKSCLDVVETKDIDNTDTVRSGLGDAGIGWPSLQGADADTLLKATVFFSEYLGWPSLLDYVIEHGTTHASQVTILPSRLTKAIVYRGFSHRKEEGFRHFFTLLTHNYARAANGSVNDTNNGNVTLEEVMSAEQRCVTFPDYQQGASDMRFCLSNTVRFFGVASYSLYVRDHYTAAVREEVESMAKAVRRTYFATLTDSTYDWASLNDTLKYLRRSQSHRLREILDDVGDIHFDIVANYRTMTVAYTKAGEDMQWLLGYELDENNPYPFRAGGEAPMLPWAIEFPYYRHDVPAYLRYGSFVNALARATAWQHRSHKAKFTKPHESCCRRSAGNVTLGAINSASAIEASAILYQKARWSHGDGDEASLPGLAHMSPLQLFFVSGCYIYCKRQTDHIPCNAALRWSADFRKAFQCLPGSPMLANETCPVLSSSGSRQDARSTQRA